jgi:hypothetical protein
MNGFYYYFKNDRGELVDDIIEILPSFFNGAVVLDNGEETFTVSCNQVVEFIDKGNFIRLE